MKEKKYFIILIFLFVALSSFVYFTKAQMAFASSQVTINTGAKREKPSSQDIENFNKFKQLTLSLPIQKNTFALKYSKEKDLIIVDLFLPDYSLGKSDFQKWVSDNGYGYLPKEYFRYNLTQKTATGATSTLRPSNAPSVTLRPSTPTPVPNNVRSVTIDVSEDAYVDKSNPSSNYGSSRNLYSAYSPNMNILQKYDLTKLAGGSIKSAILKMNVCQSSSCSTKGGFNLYISPSSRWSEGNVNYNNQPAALELVGSFNGAQTAQNLEISINPTLLQKYTGKVTFIIKPKSASDNVIFYSKESTIGRPTLKVSY